MGNLEERCSQRTALEWTLYIHVLTWTGYYNSGSTSTELRLMAEHADVRQVQEKRSDLGSIIRPRFVWTLDWGPASRVDPVAGSEERKRSGTG